MKTEKDQLVSQTKQQSNPYTARPEDFEIMRDDDEIFHGQRSDELLKQTDTHGKSKFGAPRLPATETSDAGAPRTPGMNKAEGV